MKVIPELVEVQVAVSEPPGAGAIMLVSHSAYVLDSTSQKKEYLNHIRGRKGTTMDIDTVHLGNTVILFLIIISHRYSKTEFSLRSS